MSLRDQLIAKGLVSAKRAGKLDREARRERKKRSGSREKKKSVEREEQRALEAEQVAREAARTEARRAHRRAQEAHELLHRTRSLIRSNRLRVRGPIPFHHRSREGTRLCRMSLTAGAVRLIEQGEAAVVAFPTGSSHDYAVVPRQTAEALQALAPGLVVHFRTDAAPAEPAEPRDWEPDLRARRATAADIARLRGA